MGTRVDVELESGERLSLRFPRGHAVGGGTCESETLAAELTTRERRPRSERVFASIDELLGCLFPEDRRRAERS